MPAAYLPGFQDMYDFWLLSEMEEVAFNLSRDSLQCPAGNLYGYLRYAQIYKLLFYSVLMEEYTSSQILFLSHWKGD